MTHKIVDIIPPRKKNSVVEVQAKRREINPSTKTKVFAFILFLLAIGSVYFLYDGSAEVSVYPRTEPITIEETVLVKAEEAFINYEEGVIPGEYFTETKHFEEIYNATGSDESAQEATGTIRVYNKHSSGESVTLVKGTHFLSSPQGLSYHSLTVINIPAMSDGNPGYVDIEVEADEAGEDYNIDSATFSIPKLSGTSYYSTTWAELIEGSISGGTMSEVRVVTEKDLSDAETDFKQKYAAQAIESLKENIPSNYIFFEESFDQQIANFMITAEEGDVADTFKISGDITTNILVFRENDVDKYIEAKMLEDRVDGEEIVPGTEEKQLSSTGEEDDGLSLFISASCDVYPYPDEYLLLKDLIEKDIAEAKSSLGDIPDIIEVKIDRTPFWKTRMPKELKDINLNILFYNEQ